MDKETSLPLQLGTKSIHHLSPYLCIPRCFLNGDIPCESSGDRACTPAVLLHLDRIPWGSFHRWNAPESKRFPGGSWLWTKQAGNWSSAAMAPTLQFLYLMKRVSRNYCSQVRFHCQSSTPTVGRPSGYILLNTNSSRLSFWEDVYVYCSILGLIW